MRPCMAMTAPAPGVVGGGSCGQHGVRLEGNSSTNPPGGRDTQVIEEAISTFVHSLNTNWKAVRDLEEASQQEGLLGDWAQASWEALVEASIPFKSRQVRLVVYGDGADCHTGSSRFSSPADAATHQVRCRPIDDMVVDRLSGKPVPGSNDGYALDRFVSFGDAWFFEKPPFDHALIEGGGREYVVATSRLTWELAEV